LDFVGHLTGIPDLVPDPNMFGGGTHENLNGQELDPHVDFNFDPASGMHRRLNLLIYLNKEWSEDWGGCIELHSNPREAEANTIRSFAPLFNRLVIFETNEHSWHGFREITLPEHKQHLSRKSIAVYLYTTSRPSDEVAPSHGTFYVQLPLPEMFAPGHRLTDQDVRQLKALLQRRDAWIERYQAQELTWSASLEELALKVAPLTFGYVRPTTQASGWHTDGWLGKDVELSYEALRPVTSLVIRTFLPETFPEVECSIGVDDGPALPTRIKPGSSDILVPISKAAGERFVVRMKSQNANNLALTGAGGDTRDLVAVLVHLCFEHS
jgi:hypothetical protein